MLSNQAGDGQTTVHFTATGRPRMAFILAVTGSAVGLGNIWKFPYIAGQNGGGAFVLVYLVCVVVIGMPVMMSEILIGRRGRRNPVATMELARQGRGQLAQLELGRRHGRRCRHPDPLVLQRYRRLDAGLHRQKCDGRVRRGQSPKQWVPQFGGFVGDWRLIRLDATPCLWR